MDFLEELKKEKRREQSAGKYYGLGYEERKELTLMFVKKKSNRRKNKQARISRARNRK